MHRNAVGLERLLGNTAAAEIRAVSIEYHLVPAAMRNAYPVVAALNGYKVADCYKLLAVIVDTSESYYALLVVIV